MSLKKSEIHIKLCKQWPENLISYWSCILKFLIVKELSSLLYYYTFNISSSYDCLRAEIMVWNQVTSVRSLLILPLYLHTVDTKLSGLGITTWLNSIISVLNLWGFSSWGKRWLEIPGFVTYLLREIFKRKTYTMNWKYWYTIYSILKIRCIM